MSGKILVLFIAFCLIICLIPNIKADGENWLEGWDYRKSALIISASNAGTNYQFFIIADYGSGTDLNEIVYLNGKCQTDFDDVWITQSDGSTIIAGNYSGWIEEKIDSNYAKIWFKLPDDISTDNVTVYVYYGNNEAVFTEFGEQTFNEFDDFEDASYNATKWITKSGSPVESNGYLRVQADTIESQNNQIISNKLRYRIRSASSGVDAQYIGLLDSSYVEWNIRLGTSTAPQWRLRTDDNDVGGTEDTSINYPSVDIWYICQHNWFVSSGIGQHVNLFINDTSEAYNSLQIPEMTPVIRLQSYNSNPQFDLDYIFIAKYVYPEPYIYEWGEQETQLAPTPTPTPSEIDEAKAIGIGGFIIACFAVLLVLTRDKR